MQVRRKEREEGRTDRGTGPIGRPSIAIRKSGIRSRNIEKRVDTERYRENEHAWRELEGRQEGRPGLVRTAAGSWSEKDSERKRQRFRSSEVKG